MTRNISFKFNDIAGKTFNFETLETLINFLKSEMRFWQKQRDLLTDQKRALLNCINYSSTIVRFLDSLKSLSENTSLDENQFQQQFGNLRNQYLSGFGSSFLWSGHPFVKRLIELHQAEGQNLAASFLNYVTKRQLGNVNSDVDFRGAMYGYEFLHQDSELVKRRKSERSSLNQLANRLETTTNDLVEDVEAFKSNFSSWDQNTKVAWDKWLESANELHAENQDNINSEFEGFINERTNRLDNLEVTYEEKLRLSGPASYWNKASKRYGCQGMVWMVTLLAFVTIGIVVFAGLFGDWLKGQQIDVQLNTIQGIVMFGTLLAVYAFAIRALARLTFSSFHLMRDAEEREQLTHLYLSLVNDNKVDQEARGIILQSLFSRTETGLLNSESGPTMPSVTDIIKAAPK